MGDLYNQPVVLDNGSGTLKAGFAGEDIPKLYALAIVGRPKYQKIMTASDDGGPDATYVGDQAQQHRGLLRLLYPLEHGVVTCWDDMQRVWSHSYAVDLKANPEEHPLLITEAPLNPRSNRDRMAQVLFEQMNVPTLYVLIQAVLALYALGRTTGVVVDLGDGVSHVVPVYEGFALPTLIKRIDIAGRDVTRHLGYHIARTTGCQLRLLAEMEIVRLIKEKTAFVLTDPVRDEKLALAAVYGSRGRDSQLAALYTLPDGRKLEVCAERFRCAEILFKPDIVGEELPGLHELVGHAIGKVDLDLRPTLYQNIILLGGNTLLPGFGERLLLELKLTQQREATAMKVKLHAPAERKYLAWIGGLILAGLLSFRKMWITSLEYAENPELVHTKCL